MAVNGKVVAIALIGGGALAAFTLTGSAHAAEAEPEKKKKTPSKSKVSRVTLSVKYAKAFGVPSSLLLATTYVQSGNRVNAKRDNKRGGAWGYGQMTLATAKEIYPRFKSKIGKEWDGTGEGLLDPALNLALTAAYLSTWWKRYKGNSRGWLLAAYAYILGPGTVRKAMPKDNGTLPKPLPANFARVRAAYSKALATAEVKTALAQDGQKPNLSGAEKVLTGKALANTITAKTTGYQARGMFGKMTKALGNAYATLDNYGPSVITQVAVPATAVIKKLDAGSVKAARQYLDSTNAMLSKYYPLMPENNEPLPAKQLEQLKLCVSGASTAAKTVDDLFKTSWAAELFAEIAAAAKAIVKKAADTVGLDKTSMAIAVAGIIGAAVLVVSMKK